MNKTPLVAFALFLPLALGAWKWSRSLEERLERPHSLHFEVVKGNMISSVKFTPPLTDAFTVYVGDLSQYKSGYQHEEWKVEHLQFRASTTQKWKTLPESLWRTDWQFLDPQAYGSPDDVKRQTTYSVFSYSRKRELLVGQYQMRALANHWAEIWPGLNYQHGTTGYPEVPRPWIVGVSPPPTVFAGCDGFVWYIYGKLGLVTTAGAALSAGLPLDSGIVF